LLEMADAGQRCAKRHAAPPAVAAEPAE